MTPTLTFPPGAMLERPLKPEDKMPPAIGSAMLCQGDSKEEVLERLKADLYTIEGVWDWSKAQIYPFRTAVRTAMGEVR